MTDRLAEWFRGLDEWRAGLEAEVRALERELVVVTAERDELRRIVAAQAPPAFVEVSPLHEQERQALIAALQQTRGVQREAARLLDISPRMMSYKLRRYGVVSRLARNGGSA